MTRDCELIPKQQSVQAQRDFRLVKYDVKYQKGILALFQSVPFKSLIWEWQFDRNPFNKPFQPVIVVNSEERVVGFNGVMPIDVTEHGKPLDAIWSCDFFVEACYRGAGVGSLLKRGLNDRAEIIMALGVSEKASKVISHLGWQAGAGLFSFKRIRTSWPPRNFAIVLVQVKNRLLGWHRMNRSRHPSNLRICAQGELPAAHEVDQLWSEVAGCYGKVITRDYRYLNWKYQKHPMARYAFVVAREDELLKAIIVVRFCNGTLRIVDYCGPVEDQSLKDRLAEFCGTHWKHGSQFVMTTSDPELGKSFLATGYYRSHTRPKFFVRTRPGMEAGDLQGWFLMGGDSDGELLLAARQFQEGG